MSSTNAANLFSFNGMVAVVTGGGTGIGLLMTKALEENGAKVYIFGRRLEVLKKAAEQAKHQNIIPLQGGVTIKEDLARVVEIIREKDGFINLLIANSGISGPQDGNSTEDVSLNDLRGRLWNISTEAFTQTFNVNLTAVFFSVTKKGNTAQKSQIVAVASAGAFNRIPIGGWAYGASKAGVVHMMKQAATLFAPYDIRYNILAPGLYPSEGAEAATEKYKDKEGLFPRTLVPLQSIGTKEDMAGNILFMTSRAGAYLNGSVLLTDGGRLSVAPSAY
ncbi:Short-chain dehydrogenase/reductase SAT3 [Lachnellula suecica]|uniref:Short-chain dehydrogenase/reductase SAT3 n=1 Tax=Lachnellula suecica TaxID=602035 RepID=A0A8T9C4U6_9HELO|nr:Short-chain dehydrogenase/reductase SAT3 [Lachnellula suecica]